MRPVPAPIVWTLVEKMAPLTVKVADVVRSIPVAIAAPPPLQPAVALRRQVGCCLTMDRRYGSPAGARQPCNSGRRHTQFEPVGVPPHTLYGIGWVAAVRPGQRP